MRTPKPRLAPNATIHLSATRQQQAAGASSTRALPPVHPKGTFQAESEYAMENICSSVRAVCASLDADPLHPQDISRRFSLNKNLTWKFARVLVAESSLDAIAMLPGPEGIEIFLRALEGAGADAISVAAMRHAIAVFDEIVVRHFGARTELELALDGMRTDGNLETSRRLAFRGLSGVVGMQATTRFTMQIIGPSLGDSDLADAALVAGLAGIRRLRPGTALPVFRSSATTVAGGSTEALVHAPGDGLGDFLLRDFSSFPHAKVLTTEKDGRMSVELGDGPLGRVGEANLFFGSVLRKGYSTRRREDDLIAAFVTSINLPVENLVSDIYVHASHGQLDSLRTSIHATMSGSLSNDESRHARTALPIDLKPQVFANATEAPALDCIARHDELVECAFNALGYTRAEFKLIRVVLQYPPVPAALFEAWDLPE